MKDQVNVLIYQKHLMVVETEKNGKLDTKEYYRNYDGDWERYVHNNNGHIFMGVGSKSKLEKLFQENCHRIASDLIKNSTMDIVNQIVFLSEEQSKNQYHRIMIPIDQGSEQLNKTIQRNLDPCAESDRYKEISIQLVQYATEVENSYTVLCYCSETKTLYSGSISSSFESVTIEKSDVPFINAIKEAKQVYGENSEFVNFLQNHYNFYKLSGGC